MKDQSMSEDSKPPEDIDPIEIEINLIQELIGENIIVVLHQNGMTVMMDDDIEDRTDEQMKMFSRLYVAANPSFVLRFFLMIEVGMLLVWEYLEDFYKSIVKKP
tara:strand:+ start:364 stop:675 length:312 start_codon:yes stop_codon:yes gene_type:complete